jgi:5-formyltetrahydrofolate cyclo-ligase
MSTHEESSDPAQVPASDLVIDQAKAQLRRVYRRARHELPAPQRQQESAQACQTLQRLIGRLGATALASYAALGGELDLEALHRWWWGQGRTLLLPRALAGGILRWHAVGSAEELEIGRFGIRQPRADAPEGLPGAALVLVPGVAFSRDGQRLGQGGGYYDRALRGHQGISVGIGFSCQECAQIPHAAHDRAMGMVVLAGRLWEAGQEGAPG